LIELFWAVLSTFKVNNNIHNKYNPIKLSIIITQNFAPEVTNVAKQRTNVFNFLFDKRDTSGKSPIGEGHIGNWTYRGSVYLLYILWGNKIIMKVGNVSLPIIVNSVVQTGRPPSLLVGTCMHKEPNGMLKSVRYSETKNFAILRFVSRGQ